MNAERNPSWCQEQAGGVLVRIRVQPGASRTQAAGLHGDRLKIRVSAPPVEGRANEELLGFLKQALGLRGDSIRLVRGLKSRQKDFFCAGITVAQVVACFSPMER